MRIAMQLSTAIMLSAVLGCAAVGGMSADTAVTAVQTDNGIDESDFYRSLAPHGQWAFVADYGWAWRPGHLAQGWRPYTLGRWVWLEPYGWTWDSYEPWGWAAYHYGRWFSDPLYGWMWLPGDVWAPAWVGWRVGDGFIGWAPLPPGPYGYDYGSAAIDWSYWNFASQRDFTSPHIDRDLLDRDHSEKVFKRANDVTRFEERGHEAVSRSIDRATIERATGRRIEDSRIVDVRTPGTGAEGHGAEVPLYRPRVRNRSDAPTPDRIGLAPAPGQRSERRTREESPAAGGTGAPATVGQPSPRPGPGRDFPTEAVRSPRDAGTTGARPDRMRNQDRGDDEAQPPPAGRWPGEPRRPPSRAPMNPMPPAEPRAPMMEPSPAQAAPAAMPRRSGGPGEAPRSRGGYGLDNEDATR